MCLRISCAVMGPSHSLLAQPMSWEIDVAVENLKRKKKFFFYISSFGLASDRNLLAHSLHFLPQGDD